MDHITNVNRADIELRARQMRAEALASMMQAMGSAIARLFRSATRQTDQRRPA